MRSPRFYCAIPRQRVCARLRLLQREGGMYFFPGETACCQFSESEIIGRGCRLWAVPGHWDYEIPTRALYLQCRCLQHIGFLDVATYLRPHHFHELPFLPEALVTVAAADLIESQIKEWSKRLWNFMKKVDVNAPCSREAIEVGLGLSSTPEMRRNFLDLYYRLPPLNE